MDTKAKVVIALVVVLVLGELAYIFLLAPPQGNNPGTGRLTQQELQVPYLVVSHGDKIVFEGNYQSWMQPYIKNYYTENNTTLAIVKREKLQEFYDRLKEENRNPVVLTYLVSLSLVNHSYNDYLIMLPENTTIILQGVYLLQDGEVVQTGPLKPVIEREVVTVPYRLSRIIETRYKYVIPFEERIKYQNHSNICVNVSSSKKQPYVTYLGPDYIIVNDTFTNLTRIEEDYPGAICLPTIIISNKPLNITDANLSQVYMVILEPLVDGYPEITTEIETLNKTSYNITMEVARSGDAIINYIMLK